MADIEYVSSLSWDQALSINNANKFFIERRGGCRYVLNQSYPTYTPKKCQAMEEFGSNVLERPTRNDKERGVKFSISLGRRDCTTYTPPSRAQIADRNFAQQRSRREDSSASSLTAALTSTSTFARQTHPLATPLAACIQCHRRRIR